jgi:hypothetical protein
MQAPATGYGADVLVNDPGVDTPELTTQSEPTLAVRSSTICAGYNDTGRGPVPNPLSGLSRSADRGVTWTDRGHTGRGRFSDPVLAVHQASGAFYYASLAALNSKSAVAVATSTDDCDTFPRVANASPSGVLEDLQDKPWIAVDNTGGPRDGNVYVCWTRFVDGLTGPATSDEIRFSRSTDGGATFGDEQVLSPPTDFYPFGCHVDVGPGGEVYVAWSDRGDDFPIRFRRSQDGGLTWSAAVQVNTMRIRHPGMDRYMECEPDQTRPTLNGDIRMLVQAWMAVDTTGGRFHGSIYIVWAHDPFGSTDNSDVFLNRSTDGGLTWTREVPIGAESPTDQFLPVVEVGGAGTVAIAWYDRRNDPANNFAIELYTGFSRDGGETIEAPVPVSDVSFLVPPITGQPTASGNFDPGRSACYMGDYIALAADEQYFYYAWGDNRDTVYSTRYPGGRPDPDVRFDRLLVSPSPSPIPSPTPCAADCNGDGEVTVDELLTAVNIALGNAEVSACPPADASADGVVTVDEILRGVDAALDGCD